MKKQHRIGIGLVFIALGLVLNEWIIAAIISPDGVIKWTPYRIMIWSLDVLLILFGLAVIFGFIAIRIRLVDLPKMIIIALISVVVVLLMLEGLLRIFPLGVADFKEVGIRYEFERSTQYHPKWGWSFLPNIDAVWDWTGRERTTISTSFRTLPMPGYQDYGMRDDGLNAEAQAVIPVFGDSFTFGATVERDEIWSELIEERNPEIDMLNLANGGGLTKATEQYQILRDLLPSHDFVIYEMWLGNEFLDNWALPRGQGQLGELQQAHSSRIKELKFQTMSKLAVVAFKAADRIQEIQDPQQDELAYVDEGEQLWDDEYGNFYLYPANPILNRYAEPETEDEKIVTGIQNTRDALVQMKSLAGERTLVIILFPFKSQLYDDIVMPQRPELELTKPNNIVMDFCKELEIMCLDLLPALKQYKAEKLYWDYDMHFTEAGQYHASVEIESMLKQQGILPAE